jgi:hypothetical protein
MDGQRASAVCLAQLTHGLHSKNPPSGSKPLPTLLCVNNHEILTLAHSACPESVSNQQKNVNLLLRIINQN